MVEYRDVPGFPGYRVGDDGSVWTSRAWRRFKEGEWREMKPTPDDEGRLKVGLWREKKRRDFKVHTLVLTCFVGPRPPGMAACHFPDSDQSNNRLSNLRWDTPQNNEKDKEYHGTKMLGEKHPCSKLKESVLPRIAELRGTGLSYAAIGRQLGFATMTVFRAHTGRSWKHVGRDAAGPQPTSSVGVVL